MDIFVAVGRRFRWEREVNHLTQTDVSEAVGFSVHSICCFEKGKQWLGYPAVSDLCLLVGISPSKLFEGISWVYRTPTCDFKEGVLYEDQCRSA
jgi:transcriptional regulator with XRE-family HTH domain